MTMQTPSFPTLCIGILAMNEGHRLQRCLQSAQFANQIIVVDSGSVDDTCRIASEAGAEVYIYADWQGFAVQRNRLLEHVKTDYIFFLDADEVITPSLQAEIEQAVASGQDAVWEVLWNQVAYGKALTWMKSTSGIRRLFKTSNIVTFEGVVHEGAILREPNTRIYTLHHRLLHYSRETVHGSLLKLAQYTQLGATKRAAKKQRGGIMRGLASGLTIFIKLYFLRRGFLCGAQGFLFCFFIALECFFRYVALKYDNSHLGNQWAKR